MEREILANGKSRAFVANRPATAAFLKDLAPHLGDIHGQHDQQQLFSSAVQREMLDAFAGAPVDEAAGLYQAWRAAQAELDELDRTAQEKLRLADLWSFQAKEIEAVNPQPGEDSELENDRRVLRNVVRLEETANAAYASLYDAPESAAAQLRTAVEAPGGARPDRSKPQRKSPRHFNLRQLPWMKPRTRCAIILRSWKPIRRGWMKSNRAWLRSKN